MAKKENASVKMLIALRPILFEGRQFETGDRLPCNDQKMIKAWIECQSAKWTGDEVKNKQKAEAKKDESLEEISQDEATEKAEKEDTEKAKKEDIEEKR